MVIPSIKKEKDRIARPDLKNKRVDINPAMLPTKNRTME
tara:strand:- start:250 stop:366 length:117 start_codon:yes stop_codon:yes gene_type:complete